MHSRFLDGPPPPEECAGGWHVAPAVASHGFAHRGRARDLLPACTACQDPPAQDSSPSSFQPSTCNAPSQTQSAGGWVQGLFLAALGPYPTGLHCCELWVRGSHNGFPWACQLKCPLCPLTRICYAPSQAGPGALWQSHGESSWQDPPAQELHLPAWTHQPGDGGTKHRFSTCSSFLKLPHNPPHSRSRWDGTFLPSNYLPSFWQQPCVPLFPVSWACHPSC